MSQIVSISVSREHNEKVKLHMNTSMDFNLKNLPTLQLKGCAPVANDEHRYELSISHDIHSSAAQQWEITLETSEGITSILIL